MSSTAFDTRRASTTPDLIAADGCEARVLCAIGRDGHLSICKTASDC